MRDEPLFLPCIMGMFLLTGKITRQVKMLDRCWIKPPETKKGLTAFSSKSLLYLARLTGFEPVTYGLEDVQ